MRESDAVDLSLRGGGRCLRLADCPEVLDALRAALPGWPLSVSPARGLAPAVRLAAHGAGYRQRSPQWPRGVRTSSSVAAACSLSVDLIEHFLRRHPELIGLHAAAVEVGGRLVVLPETHRAGKSILTAAFAAAGHRVHGDDVVALTPSGEGMALGVAPRLRLPLPAGLDPSLAAFIAHHTGLEDARYRYLDLPPGRLAPHGERRPLAALVLLERDESLAAPELLPLAPGEGLVRLLCQHVSHRPNGEALMASLLPLVSRLPCGLLRYGEPLAAARWLATEMGEWPAVPDEAALTLLPSPAAGMPSATASRDVPSDAPWRPAPQVRDHPLHDELFLIDGASGAIHRLNVTGRALWTLLRLEALTAEELTGLLAEHHGSEEPARIAPDVAAWLAGMSAAGLIRTD